MVSLIQQVLDSKLDQLGIHDVDHYSQADKEWEVAYASANHMARFKMGRTQQLARECRDEPCLISDGCISSSYLPMDG